MAKIRDLKNEINYLTFEIISDCNTFMAHNPQKKQEVLSLVEETVALRNKLIQQINHPKEVSRSYFKIIREELISQADAIFKKLRALI